jgi:hypothetical protein
MMDLCVYCKMPVLFPRWQAETRVLDDDKPIKRVVWGVVCESCHGGANDVAYVAGTN